MALALAMAVSFSLNLKRPHSNLKHLRRAEKPLSVDPCKSCETEGTSHANAGNDRPRQRGGARRDDQAHAQPAGPQSAGPQPRALDYAIGVHLLGACTAPEASAALLQLKRQVLSEGSASCRAVYAQVLTNTSALTSPHMSPLLSPLTPSSPSMCPPELEPKFDLEELLELAGDAVAHEAVRDGLFGDDDGVFGEEQVRDARVRTVQKALECNETAPSRLSSPAQIPRLPLPGRAAPSLSLSPPREI
eukprot:6199497-Pleurochrysis_carterae.AAC.1